jgi:hypothetical protein
MVASPRKPSELSWPSINPHMKHYKIKTIYCFIVLYNVIIVVYITRFEKMSLKMYARLFYQLATIDDPGKCCY